MTDLSHIEGLKQGEQMYVVEIEFYAGFTRNLRPMVKAEAERWADDARKQGLSATVYPTSTVYLCPECERPLDKVWKDAKQTEVDHLSCRNDDCRWNSKDRLQHPRKKEEGTGRKSATWGT